MGHRHFSNAWSDYVAPPRSQDEIDESQTVLITSSTSQNVALKIPPSFREHLFPSPNEFLSAALDLRNEIVQETWMRNRPRVSDPTLYSGALGTAFLCWRVSQITGSKDDLALCADVIDSCDARSRSMKPNVSFLVGQPGIYALGAAAAKQQGDLQKLNYYLKMFNEVAQERNIAAGPDQGGLGMPYELLYGRAGFLWAALFINMHVGEQIVPWSITGAVVAAIIAGGKAGASKTDCPLMFEWHGSKYWGAAHGLAGIIHVLLHFPLSKLDMDRVTETLKYMIRNRLPSGNYRSSEGRKRDELVQWCHGAPGVLLTLCKASEVHPADNEFQAAAIEAGEVVWKRGLLRRLGLCHGVSGNAYTFLALYRSTGQKKYLHRARLFAGFLHQNAKKLIATGEMHGGDHPHSLYEGLAGTACLWLDLVRAEHSRFPGIEFAHCCLKHEGLATGCFIWDAATSSWLLLESGMLQEEMKPAGNCGCLPLPRRLVCNYDVCDVRAELYLVAIVLLSTF